MNIPRVLLWSARSTAALLFFFWGSFFYEHLNEWYIGKTQFPPMHVSLTVAAHALLLIGYLISFKFEKTGMIMITLFSFLFFMPIMGLKGLPFTLISLLPAALYFLSHYLKSHNNTTEI